MKTLFFSFFFCLNALFAQSQTVGLVLADLKAPPQYLSSFLLKKTAQKAINQQVVNPAPRPMPLVFNVETLPFFCKIEHKMGLNQKMPIKFRLGDVQYVDELEGKRRPN
jgi:hypothetical protein